ncbi:hypothetical protein HAV15_000104 [Penicillium sp. str. |nr:hypothetical protein HAV15_000104 [Penicillium sp. str. \
MRETFEPAMLERKAAAMRKSTGNSQLRARTYNKDRTPAQILAHATVRPLKMLLSPIILPLSLYCAFMFGLVYLLFTTFPAVFETTYHFATDISGLAYLGLGVGMIISIGLFAFLSDKLLKQPREGTLERPELRLILMIWSSPVVPVGLLWYGWSAEKVTHWIVPILGTMFIGLGALLILMPAQLYLVDAFGFRGSRICPCYEHCFALFVRLLAFIGLAFSPLPFLFYKYGETLRTKFPITL